MILPEPKYFLILGIAALIILSGCSSSSQSQRYNKPKIKEEEKSDGVRFTSDNDVKLREDSTASTKGINYITEFDEEPVEDYPVDNEEFIVTHDRIEKLSAALTPRDLILLEIIRFLDTPYKYGGNSEKGIDCSAFTQQVLSNSVNLNLPRTASEQYKIGNQITNRSELQFGDLVFFNTRRNSFPGHVGIYIGEDLFAHASRTQGVTISSFKSTYYFDRFVGARRIDSANQ